MGNPLKQKETMSEIETNDHKTTESNSDGKSITEMLKKPFTFTAPGWAFALAGVVALALLIAAFD